MWDLSGIQGVTADSRAVRNGFLFAAIQGAQYDGRRFIPDAVKAGAASILAEEKPEGLPGDVRWIETDHVRRDFAKLTGQFYGGRAAQPEEIVAVTGTNGKSSVVTFLEHLWCAQGYKAASLGTINARLTSLDPVALHEALKAYKRDGVSHLALEASSHGLDQYRVDGAHISAAGFTNLSRDHLDYHPDMETYFQAKLRLFTGCLAADGRAVINADAPEAERVAQAVRASGADRSVLLYGDHAPKSQLCIETVRPVAGGMEVTCVLFDRPYALTIPLVGRFQLSNLFCALGLAVDSVDPSHTQVKACIDALQTVQAVKGRLQSVPGHPGGASVYIDYAHTPDGLKTVLMALRPHVKGRLLCVFGCGGDRDKGKRPLMGEVAANHSDMTIITDDNPRFEKPVDIRNQILAPIRNRMHNDHVFEIGDRAAAIDFSIQQLQEGDALVIAGKGHETGQILADRVEPFDDYTRACQALERITREDAG